MKKTATKISKDIEDVNSISDKLCQTHIPFKGTYNIYHSTICWDYRTRTHISKDEIPNKKIPKKPHMMEIRKYTSN